MSQTQTSNSLTRETTSANFDEVTYSKSKMKNAGLSFESLGFLMYLLSLGDFDFNLNQLVSDTDSSIFKIKGMLRELNQKRFIDEPQLLVDRKRQRYTHKMILAKGRELRINKNV